MTLMYDGHDFESLFIVGDPEISILNSVPSFIESDSLDGSAVSGRKWGNSTVAFTLVVEGNASERRDKLSILGSWLDVDEPKQLVLPDTPDRYYMAVPDGSIDLTRGIGAEYAKVQFTITEPVSYGDEHTVTVGSNAVTINVNGTAPTRPVITADAVRDQESLLWGIILDGQEFVHIATGVNSAVPIVVDCENRTLDLGGYSKLPTLDSDWLSLEPGVHTLRIDNGSGNAQVTWRECWL